MTDSERLLIELKRREVRSKKEHVRLSVLIMLDAGFSHEAIALSQGIHTATITNWKQKYESVSRDLDRYLADNYVAFQGYLSAEQLTALDAHLQDQLYVNARQLGDYLCEQYRWVAPSKPLSSRLKRSIAHPPLNCIPSYLKTIGTKR